MMIDTSIPPRVGDTVAGHLRERVAMSLLLEEHFVATLQEAAERLLRDGDDEAARLADLVRAQRQGLAERRERLEQAGIAL